MGGKRTEEEVIGKGAFTGREWEKRCGDLLKGYAWAGNRRNESEGGMTASSLLKTRRRKEGDRKGREKGFI